MSDGHEEATHPDELVIELDGDGVHLDTMDAPRVLELATAYLELLARCAADRDQEIEFRGLRAFEKCASLGTFPSQPDAARMAIADAATLLASPKRPGYGLVEPVRRVRAAHSKLPAGYRARVMLRRQTYDIVTEPRDTPPALSPASTTVLRAYVQRVGGATPRATFHARSESKLFTLDLKDTEQSERLARYLYKTVDVEARVTRDASGAIEGGRVSEFHALNTENPLIAWRQWFRENAVQSLDELDDEGGGDGRSR